VHAHKPYTDVHMSMHVHGQTHQTYTGRYVQASVHAVHVHTHTVIRISMHTSNEMYAHI